MAAHMTLGTAHKQLRRVFKAIEYEVQGEISHALREAIFNLPAERKTDTKSFPVGFDALNQKKYLSEIDEEDRNEIMLSKLVRANGDSEPYVRFRDYILAKWETGYRKIMGDQVNEDWLRSTFDVWNQYLDKHEAWELELTYDIELVTNAQSFSWSSEVLDESQAESPEDLADFEVGVEADPLIHIRNLVGMLNNQITGERLNLNLFPRQRNEEGELVDGYDRRIGLKGVKAKVDARLKAKLKDGELAVEVLGADLNLSRQYGPDGELIHEGILVPEKDVDELLDRLSQSERLEDIFYQAFRLDSLQEMLDQLSADLKYLSSLNELKMIFWLERTEAGGIQLQQGFKTEETLAAFQKALDDPEVQVIAQTETSVPLKLEDLDFRLDADNGQFVAEVDLPEKYRLDWTFNHLAFPTFLFGESNDPLVQEIYAGLQGVNLAREGMKLTTNIKIAKLEEAHARLTLPLELEAPEGENRVIPQVGIEDKIGLELPVLKEEDTRITELELQFDPELDPLKLDLMSSTPLSQQVYDSLNLFMGHLVYIVPDEVEGEIEDGLVLKLNEILSRMNPESELYKPVKVGGMQVSLLDVELAEDAISTDFRTLIPEMLDSEDINLEEENLLRTPENALGLGQDYLIETPTRYRFRKQLKLPETLKIRLENVSTEEADIERLDLTLKADGPQTLDVIWRITQDRNGNLVTIMEYDNIDALFAAYSPVLEGKDRPVYQGLKPKGKLGDVKLSVNKGWIYRMGQNLSIFGKVFRNAGELQDQTADEKGVLGRIQGEAVGAIGKAQGSISSAIGDGILSSADKTLLKAIEEQWEEKQRELRFKVRQGLNQSVNGSLVEDNLQLYREEREKNYNRNVKPSAPIIPQSTIDCHRADPNCFPGFTQEQGDNARESAIAEVFGDWSPSNSLDNLSEDDRKALTQYLESLSYKDSGSDQGYERPSWENFEIEKAPPIQVLQFLFETQEESTLETLPIYRPLGEVQAGDQTVRSATTEKLRNLVGDIISGTADPKILDALPDLLTNSGIAELWDKAVVSKVGDEYRNLGARLEPTLEDPDSEEGLVQTIQRDVDKKGEPALNGAVQEALNPKEKEVEAYVGPLENKADPVSFKAAVPLPTHACFYLGTDESGDPYDAAFDVLAYVDKPHDALFVRETPLEGIEPELALAIEQSPEGMAASVSFEDIEAMVASQLPGIEQKIIEAAQFKEKVNQSLARRVTKLFQEGRREEAKALLKREGPITRKVDNEWVNDSLEIKVGGTGEFDEDGKEKRSIQISSEEVEYKDPKTGELHTRVQFFAEAKLEVRQDTYAPFQQSPSALDGLSDLLYGWWATDVDFGKSSKIKIPLSVSIENVEGRDSFTGEETGRYKGYNLDVEIMHFDQLGVLDGEFGTIADNIAKGLGETEIGSASRRVRIEESLGLPGIDQHFQILFSDPVPSPNEKTKDRILIPFRLHQTEQGGFAEEPSSRIVPRNYKDYLEDYLSRSRDPRGPTNFELLIDDMERGGYLLPEMPEGFKGIEMNVSQAQDSVVELEDGRMAFQFYMNFKKGSSWANANIEPLPSPVLVRAPIRFHVEHRYLGEGGYREKKYIPMLGFDGYEVEFADPVAGLVTLFKDPRFYSLSPDSRSFLRFLEAHPPIKAFPLESFPEKQKPRGLELAN